MKNDKNQSIDEKKQADNFEKNLRNILEYSPNARILDRNKSFIVPWVPVPG